MTDTHRAQRRVFPQRMLGEDRAVLEQAKGALMLRYGVGSHVAFAALLRWSRASDTSLEAMSHTLVHDICQDGLANSGDSALVPWLEEQLRHDLPNDVTSITPPRRGPKTWP